MHDPSSTTAFSKLHAVESAQPNSAKMQDASSTVALALKLSATGSVHPQKPACPPEYTPSPLNSTTTSTGSSAPLGCTLKFRVPLNSPAVLICAIRTCNSALGSAFPDSPRVNHEKPSSLVRDIELSTVKNSITLPLALSMRMGSCGTAKPDSVAGFSKPIVPKLSSAKSGNDESMYDVSVEALQEPFIV